MSTKYKANELGKAYFVTLTVVNWIDVFTRLSQRYLLINSLRYCQREKGLEIYAYCIMPSHIHILCKAEENKPLSDVIRDFKKFTSRKIIENIITEKESRREWMLKLFSESCEHLARNQKYKVWQDGYHAEIMETPRFLYQKLNYIHNNPVVDKFVDFPEDYLFSSARNYAGMDSLLDIVILSQEVRTHDVKSHTIVRI
ncbi:MAG TPA: transposase [Bacteroidia bacterium]|nr:transposase [Bacteroidia bacterium]